MISNFTQFALLDKRIAIWSRFPIDHVTLIMSGLQCPVYQECLAGIVCYRMSIKIEKYRTEIKIGRNRNFLPESDFAVPARDRRLST